jgi:glyoxylase-like metal-dependent hydrolase (beta-lactamase superfamily II)
VHPARALPIVAVLALALPACDGTLAVAPPHAGVAPTLHAPPMSACWIELARDTQPGGYGLSGGSDDLDWDVTYSGVLIRHPGGDLLLDVGNSTHFSEERGTSRFVPNLLQKFVQGAGTRVATAPEALRLVGEDRGRLQAIALSHIHADHAGGVVDLPGTPILLAPREIAYAEAQKEAGGFDVVKAQVVSMEGRIKPIQFTRTPYENFDESADYFGDGSVVFVPLYGHTPGSIGTFINLSPTQRYFHVGDTFNTLEAVQKRRGKSVVLAFTDHDTAETEAAASKVLQLHAQDPIVKILPAHDRKAWIGAFGQPSACVVSR